MDGDNKKTSGCKAGSPYLKRLAQVCGAWYYPFRIPQSVLSRIAR
ncbi:hypothetical protein PUR_14310 [Paenibacillus sp. URB8-2]|nr:hypothetical protein PUR_14310 [Paenibacillus sp. URB8-2]